MRKVLFASLILAFALVAGAQEFPIQGDYEHFFSNCIDDKSIALVIKYIGSEENGQVDGDTDGNILLLDGDLASEAADASATSNCGAVAGTLDVSDADCDTLGELMYEINNAASGTQNWIATLVDVPPWADAGASALMILDLGTATDAKTDDGVAVYYDDTALDDKFCALYPFSNQDARNSMKNFVKGTDGDALIDQADVFKGSVTHLRNLDYIFGDADTGTGLLEFVGVNMNNVSDNDYEGIAETVLHAEASATDDTWINKDYTEGAFSFPEGWRIWVSIQQAGDTADASNIFIANYAISEK